MFLVILKQTQHLLFLDTFIFFIIFCKTKKVTIIQQYISIFPKSHLHHELTIFSRDESFYPYATKLQQTTHEIDEFYLVVTDN